MATVGGIDPQILASLYNNLTPQQISDAKWRIENTGRITQSNFEKAIGVLFGLAVLSFSGRLIIRLRSRRRLFLDDGLLAFALLCLVGGTAIMYKRINMIYLEFSVIRGDQIAALMAFSEIDELFEQSKWQLAYLLFLWTAVFSVKWCYFAFFYPFRRSLSLRFLYFYRFAIGFSVVCWLFLVIGEQVITCPYIGKEAGAKCFPELRASKGALLALFWICPALDGLTDATIISIPILILRKSRMRILQKFGLGVFLSLSVFMLSCSLIRAAGTYYHGTLDFPWQVFWLHSEACIGVIMGSVTVYHSTLVGSNEVSDKVKTYWHKLFDWLSRSNRSNDNSGDSNKQDPDHLPSKIPRATLTGLRTFFGRRTEGTTVATQDSEIGLVDIPAAYHAHIKAQAIPKAAKASRDGSNSA